MPYRIVSSLLVFLTLLTSMGESLHGLPIFDHQGREQCQSDGLHFDISLESHDVECPICEILTQYQATYDSQYSLACYECGRKARLAARCALRSRGGEWSTKAVRSLPTPYAAAGVWQINRAKLFQLLARCMRVCRMRP